MAPLAVRQASTQHGAAGRSLSARSSSSRNLTEDALPSVGVGVD